MGNHIYTFDEVREILSKKGVTVLSTKYKRVTDKILVQCINGHIWQSTFSRIKHSQGNGCPKCRKKNQYLCQEILEVLLNDKFISDCRPNWLKLTSSHALELDGYCKNKNIAFEYNGMQHYTKLSFMDLNQFKELQKRDIIKRVAVQSRGIRFIVIPYFLNKDTLSDKITKIKNILISQGVAFTDIPNGDIEKNIQQGFLRNKHKEELDLLLLKKDITLISGLPISVNDPLNVRCNKCGRVWTTHLSRLRISGCRICSILATNAQRAEKHRKYSLKDFQDFVKKRYNGQCLSTIFESVNTPMEWKCSNPDHPTWSAMPSDILRGRWCRECAFEKVVSLKKYSLEYFQDFVKEKYNGKCLSMEYKSVNTLMKWKCNNPDHPVWSATPSRILQGSWCRECAFEKKVKYSLEYFQDFVKEKYNGQCLSAEYKNANTPMKWKCSNPNHPAWSATPSSILQGHWCRKCAHKKRKSPQKYSLEYFQDFVKEKYNGQCLSTEYKDTKTPMKWKCSNPNHPAWSARPNHIIEGHWCRKCAFENQVKYSLKYFQDFVAEKYNGQCLSTEYKNTYTPMQWKCSNPNHPAWSAMPRSILEGQWCRECAFEKKRTPKKYSLKFFQDFVKEKYNGQCLSTKYKNTNTLMKWKCSNPDHPAWSARPDRILEGQWCRECALIKRRTPTKYSLKYFQDFVKEKYNGQCLSTEYHNTHTPLQWKCSNPDHPAWFAYPLEIKRGYWCPECAHEKWRQTKSPSL